MSDHARIQELESALAAMREEREQIRLVLNADLKTASERVLTLELEVAHLTEELDTLTRALAQEIWQGKVLTEEREGLKRERDLAVAHDTQPYPTAYAYEQVCKARDKWQAEATALTAAHERVRAQDREAGRYIRDLANRLLDDPTDAYKEAHEALIAYADELNALTSPEGPPTGAVVKGTPLTKGQWQVEVDGHGHVTSLRHLHDDNEPSRGAPYPNSSKAGTL